MSRRVWQYIDMTGPITSFPRSVVQYSQVLLILLREKNSFKRCISSNPSSSDVALRHRHKIGQDATLPCFYMLPQPVVRLLALHRLSQRTFGSGIPVIDGQICPFAWSLVAKDQTCQNSAEPDRQGSRGTRDSACLQTLMFHVQSL